MIDFFCKSMAENNFCDDRKSALSQVSQRNKLSLHVGPTSCYYKWHRLNGPSEVYSKLSDCERILFKFTNLLNSENGRLPKQDPEVKKKN